MSVYRGPSESQSNAEALARRGSPYTAAHETSVRLAWDYRRREPANLREAEHLVRKAYTDAVPMKMHEGPDSIGDDGTPKMTARAVGYIFGSEESDDAPRDAETGQRDPVGYYHRPFDARLNQLECGSVLEQKCAAIVSRVAVKGMDARQAVAEEGIPEWWATQTAFHLLALFLRGMSDVKIRGPLSRSTTAA
jgi:hypothetical protein